MSHEATNWAIKQRGLKPAEKIILFCLADRHNPDYGCFPNQKRLAEDAEMGERTVRRHLDALEEKGLIERVRDNRQGGAFASTRYILRFERQNDRRPDRPEANLAGGQSCPSPEANLAGDRRPNWPPNPVREPRKGTSKGEHVHSAHVDAHTDAQTEHPGDHRRAPTFDEFWMKWPLARQGKDRARKAYAKLSAEDRRRAAEQAPIWASRWRQAHPQASDIHPATYLNGKRWEDEGGAPPPQQHAGAADSERARQIAFFNRVAGGSA